MLFLLYLALPQTQGASYLYLTQLEPVLRAHESQIDAALAQLRSRIFAFLHARARMLWDAIIASATTGPLSSPAPEAISVGSSAQAPPLSASVSGPTQMLGTLWRTYGPAIVAGGTALLQRQGVSTPNNTRATTAEPMQGYDVGDGPEPVDMPHMKGRTSSSSESVAGLRERVASGTNIGPGGRFEEIEVPSDAEGERSPGGSPIASPSHQSSGWFSWATGAPMHAKSD